MLLFVRNAVHMNQKLKKAKIKGSQGTKLLRFEIMLRLRQFNGYNLEWSEPFLMGINVLRV